MGNLYVLLLLYIQGVRQGGILSPKLFSVYFDDLSDKLIKSDIGCHIDNLCMNYVMYADDICLMAPSPTSLQGIIYVCYDFDVQNDLSFNSSKSFGMVFKPKSNKLSCPILYMNNLELKFADNFKYLGFNFDQKDDKNVVITFLYVLPFYVIYLLCISTADNETEKYS